MSTATIPSPTTSVLPGTDRRLEAIREKVERGRRLSLADGALLYATPDVWGVCELADIVRRRLHADAAYYNVNRHFNYSNVCALSCKFCEFFRKPGQEGAYTRTMDDARAEARRALEAGATEMHIVGGLHPELAWDYYPELLRTLKAEAPDLHLKAFTPVEIVHFARLRKTYRKNDREARRAAVREVLSELKDAGLGSLPGGGAEVFDDRVHDQAYRGKIRSDEWLDVHLVAHSLGLNSNATVLYGHIEDRAERLFHFDLLRRAQDAALASLGYGITEPRDGHPDGPGYAAINGHFTDGREGWPGPISLTVPGAALPTPALVDARGRGYFQTIIPLPFFPDGSALEHLPGPSGMENLRTLAIARLMLDNFPHVKAFWIMQTLHMAQFMLQSGADDIDGTVVWYDITHVGGAGTHQETTVLDLRRAITEAGFRPVERDTLYRRVERDGRDGRIWRLASGG